MQEKLENVNLWLFSLLFFHHKQVMGVTGGKTGQGINEEYSLLEEEKEDNSRSGNKYEYSRSGFFLFQLGIFLIYSLTIL